MYVHLFGDCRWNSSEGQIGSVHQLRPTQTCVRRNDFHLVWPIKMCEYLSPFPQEFIFIVLDS